MPKISLLLFMPKKLFAFNIKLDIIESNSSIIFDTDEKVYNYTDIFCDSFVNFCKYCRFIIQI